MLYSRFLLVSLMVFVAVASRLLPHPANFTPVFAISLFAGAFLVPRVWAYGVPLIAMIASDAWIGFHDLSMVVYACMLVAVALGRSGRNQPTSLQMWGRGLLGSLFFFAVTNFFVWLTSGMYPLTGEGFVSCFTMALPFFRNSLLGDVFYSVLLFGSFTLLEKANILSLAIAKQNS